MTTPWIIDGDVTHEILHNASDIRVANYFSLEGSEGVLGPLDLRVLELSTPGTSIRVMPGAYGILNRALAGSYEGYVHKLLAEEQVPITATGAGSGRSDLVIRRIENPFLSGEPWINTDGPFVTTHVIEGVDPTTTDVHDLGLGYSATTLARIDIPLSTGTITNAMITDLRSRAAAGGQRVEGIVATDYVHETALGTNQWNTGAPSLDPSDITFQNWPPSASWDVPIPSSATHVVSDFEVKNAHLLGGDTWGEMRLMINGVAQPKAPIDLNQDVDFSGGYRQNLPIAGTYIVDPDDRGHVRNIHCEARVFDDPRVQGTIYSDIGTVAVLKLTFKRNPVSE